MFVYESHKQMDPYKSKEEVRTTYQNDLHINNKPSEENRQTYSLR